MNGRVNEVGASGHYIAEVVLSRRNLLALLAKLDGYPRDSKCELNRITDDGNLLIVRAEDDDVHYVDRVPGAVHPETEEEIA